MVESGQDRTNRSGLVNYDEPLDMDAHLINLQARISALEEGQKKTQHLVKINTEGIERLSTGISDILGWFEGTKRSLKFLLLVGNFLVWFSKVGTAFLILYGMVAAITGDKLPFFHSLPGIKFPGSEGDK